MKINSFFEETLGVQFNNPRWSWGAVDKQSNRVFLRFWHDQIRPDGTEQKAQIYWKHPQHYSNGYAERLKQIDMMKHGAEGFGVLTKAVDPNTNGVRQIASFREDVLFELGALTEDDDGIYARIKGTIPTVEINSTRVLPRVPTGRELAKYERIVIDGAKGKVSIEVRIRCKILRDKAREHYRGTDGKLRCEVCGWHKPTGDLVGDIVELHHLKPVAFLPSEGVQERLDKAIKSLSPLCPCCHRIAHARLGNRSNPFSINELKAIIPNFVFHPG